MTISDRSDHCLKKSNLDPKMTISCESLFSFGPGSPVFLQPIPDMTTVTRASFLGLVDPRAVLAGVSKTSFKKSLAAQAA